MAYFLSSILFQVSSLLIFCLSFCLPVWPFSGGGGSATARRQSWALDQGRRRQSSAQHTLARLLQKGETYFDEYTPLSLSTCFTFRLFAFSPFLPPLNCWWDHPTSSPTWRHFLFQNLSRVRMMRMTRRKRCVSLLRPKMRRLQLLKRANISLGRPPNSRSINDFLLFFQIQFSSFFSLFL